MRLVKVIPIPFGPWLPFFGAYGADDGKRGGWLTVGVIYGVGPFRNRGRGALYLSLGADSDLPWRPWPRVYREVRGSSRLSSATWVACFGICVGHQRITQEDL